MLRDGATASASAVAGAAAAAAAFADAAAVGAHSQDEEEEEEDAFDGIEGMEKWAGTRGVRKTFFSNVCSNVKVFFLKKNTRRACTTAVIPVPSYAFSPLINCFFIYPPPGGPRRGHHPVLPPRSQRLPDDLGGDRGEGLQGAAPLLLLPFRPAALLPLRLGGHIQSGSRRRVREEIRRGERRRFDINHIYSGNGLDHSNSKFRSPGASSQGALDCSRGGGVSPPGQGGNLLRPQWSGRALR